MLRWLAPAVAIALVLVFLCWPRRRRLVETRHEQWFTVDPRIGIKVVGRPVKIRLRTKR